MIKIPCPVGFEYDPHQIEAVDYIHKTPGNIFLCDEMGMGKTVTAIGYLNYIKCKNVLIIPKKSGVAVWTNHLNDWHVMKPKVIEYHPDEPFFEADILIAHYHWFQYKECAAEILKYFRYKILIMDEPHTLRHAGSLRAKHLYCKNGIVNTAEKTIAATGTPLFNRVMGMYPLLKGLRPEVIDGMTRHQFGLTYCGGYEGPDGKWVYNGASNVERLASKMERSCMIRRTEADTPSGLPPLLSPKIVYLKQTKERKQLVEEIENFDGNFKPDKNIYNDDNEELATLRRKLGESKVYQSACFILKEVRKVKHLVVFAYHRSVIKELHRLLSKYVTCIKLIGGMSHKKAASEIKRFQSWAKEKYIIVIASVTAFSDTITLTNSRRPIFVELSYIWNENKQAIKRLHRRGQPFSVQPLFLIFKDSFDMRKLKINFEKIKTDDEFERGRAA